MTTDIMTYATLIDQLRRRLRLYQDHPLFRDLADAGHQGSDDLRNR